MNDLDLFLLTYSVILEDFKYSKIIMGDTLYVIGSGVEKLFAEHIIINFKVGNNEQVSLG